MAIASLPPRARATAAAAAMTATPAAARARVSALAAVETDGSHATTPDAELLSPSTPVQIEDELPESIERLRAGSAALGRRMRGLEDLLADALQQCSSPVRAQTPNPPGTPSPQTDESLQLARTLHEMRQIVSEIGEQQQAQDNLTAVCAARIFSQNESHGEDASASASASSVEGDDNNEK